MHRHQKARCILLPGACSLLLAGSLAAQEPTKLADITVTARRGAEQKVHEAPVSVTVMSREAIEASPATTTEELLRGIPGVQLPYTNYASSFPGNPSIALRGLGLGDNATRVLVLLNGVPLNAPMFASVYWSRIPTRTTLRSWATAPRASRSTPSPDR